MMRSKRFQLIFNPKQFILFTLIFVSVLTVTEISYAQLPFYNAFSHNDYHRPNPVKECFEFQI